MANRSSRTGSHAAIVHQSAPRSVFRGASSARTPARRRRAQADSSLESSSTTHRRISSAQLQNALASAGWYAPSSPDLSIMTCRFAVEPPDFDDLERGIDCRSVNLRRRDVDFDSQVRVGIIRDALRSAGSRRGHSGQLIGCEESSTRRTPGRERSQVVSRLSRLRFCTGSPVLEQSPPPVGRTASSTVVKRSGT